jgi:hypothetical protein
LHGLLYFDIFKRKHFDNSSTTKDMKTSKLDLHRLPYRGILAEIAREDGVARQAVQKRAKKGDPDTLARIDAKKRTRDEKLKEYNNMLRSR